MKEKNQAAVSLGRLGGLARTKNLGKEGLSRVGKIGAKARWTKPDTDSGNHDRK